MNDDELRGQRPSDASPGPSGGSWSASGPARPRGEGVPPEPALPAADGQPRGRRYREDSLPEDWTPPLPRRSAASPSGTAEASPLTPADAPVGASAAGRTASAGTRRTRWWWLLGLVLVLVLALVGAAVLFGFRPGNPPAPASSPAPSATPDPVEAALVTPGALTGLGSGWSVVTEDAAAGGTDAAQPLCLAADDATPQPERVAERRLTRATAGATALHRIATYPDETAAHSAYAAARARLGTCPGAYLSQGISATGAADEVAGVTASVEQATPQGHTVLVARTGRFLDVLDVAQDGAAPKPAAALAVLTDSLRAQCSDASGACPSSPALAMSELPPTGDPAGWLVAGDIPRIRPDAGVWRGADQPSLRLTGSQCEVVDLNHVPGATGRHRTYLLEDDPQAPRGFGVDEAVYDFASPAAALAFSRQVAANLTDCAQRTGTATVRQTYASPSPASGATFVVDQQVSASATARFRVTVVSRGDKAVFLLANPEKSFDFSDASFNAVAKRAGERLAQLS
ncbi:hypothetical protein [Nigerium massiliense]|uniref:hypothetical protein n=1 Tax=Nigerium massiliense TaxID=1522317 RepID=UPI00058E1C9B|nr:hypothetical protein [Nigerium massiliense]